MQLKKVCIVGKANVGKSQLFNRFIGHKHSLVMETPGITRDRITLAATWLRYTFFVTDTGGVSDAKSIIAFQKDINKQAQSAIAESDLVIFLISKKDGISKDDYDIAKMLKKSQKPTILAINKCDVLDVSNDSFSHVGLGFGEGIYISAEHSINVGELLNLVVDKLNIFNGEFNQQKPDTKFAIIGKPNVGKSSLCNSLVHNDRLIVSPIAGTTHDAVDISFSYNKDTYTLIDTPGIKKNKWVTNNKLDYLLILKAKQSLKRASVVCLVIDIADGIKEMDETIAGLVYDANIPSIIVANKWDLINYKSDDQRQALEKDIRKKLQFLHWAPIIFVSATENHKTETIFKALDLINSEVRRMISDTDLKNFLMRITSLFHAPKVANKRVVLYKMTQVKSQILTFVVNCNNTEHLHFSYERLIENKFRETFNIRYSPLKFYYRSKKQSS